MRAEIKSIARDDVKNLEKKKKVSDTSSDMVEMLLEKVLVYGNNALEIYWKPDFAKYFECTELRVEKEKVHNE